LLVPEVPELTPVDVEVLLSLLDDEVVVAVVVVDVPW